MSDNMPYADIVILALIAGFILLRLRGVLGQKNGTESNPDFFKRPLTPQQSEPIVQISDKLLKPKPKDEPDQYLATLGASDIAGTLNLIKAKDPQFSATSFITGARMAFEMVFDAFAKGDKQTLKMLLSDDRLKEFSDHIDERVKDRHTDTTLVSVKAKDIVQASLDRNIARLSVSFASEQVTVVRDGEGAVIEGNASDIHHVEDQWTFERDVTSKNPNWKIIET